MALEATASVEHLSYSPSVFELSSTNEALHASLVLLILISCFRGSDGSRNSDEVQIPGYPISMELSLAELKSRFSKLFSFFDMASISQSVFAALLVLPVALAGTVKTCTNPQLSCQNTTAVSDLCCFNAPGGQLLQTQFWDTNPSTGTSLDIIFCSLFFLCY